MGVIAYYNQKALFNSLHRVEYAYTEREYFSDIRIAVEKTVMAANDYLITGDQKEREAFDRSVSEAERLFIEIPYEKVCKSCHPTAKGIVDRFYVIKGKELPEEMKYLKELRGAFAGIRSKGEEIFALDRPVGSAAGAKLMEEMDALYYVETARLIMNYRGAIRGTVAEAIAAAQGVRSRSWLIMLLVAVILAFIGLIFSRLYARSFVLPIETIHERAVTIARGDFKARLDIKSRDELGQLANAMNEMAAQLDSLYSNLNGMVEEKTRELRESEEKLRLHGEIERNMAEAVYLIRVSDGVIVYTNPFFERLFGYEPGKLIGKHVSLVNAPGDKSPEAVANEIISILMRTGVWNGEVHNIRKDGTTFWCHANVFTFEHPQYGRVWLSMHQDITERKKMEEELAKHVDELERYMKATVQREFRIKELRDRVEELEKRLKG